MLCVDMRGCGGRRKGEKGTGCESWLERKGKGVHIPRRKFVFFLWVLRMVDFVVVIFFRDCVRG